MRNVRITYIPENAIIETSDILVDVVRVYEGMRGESLNIEIDDANKRNSTNIISTMTHSKIVKIELLDNDNNVEFEFSSYTVLKPINRVYYDANKYENKLHLAFLIEQIN